MLKSGAKPIKHLPWKRFHDRYPRAAGAIGFTDFNVDKGLWMPDQIAEGAQTECTGYSVTDILADIFGELFSPDWQYAMTQWLQGSTPTEDGADPHVAMQSAILLGALPQSDAPFNAKSMGELYCANWRNWPSNENRIAAAFGQNGVLDALGNGDPLSSITAATSLAKMGVSCTTMWYEEWELAVPASGILPMPANPQQRIVPNYGTLPYHNWVSKGQKTINGQTYGIVKSWQGAKVGDNGFLYIGHDVAEAVFEVPGTGAICFDPEAVRVLSEVKIIVERFFPILASSLPASLQALYVGGSS